MWWAGTSPPAHACISRKGRVRCFPGSGPASSRAYPSGDYRVMKLKPALALMLLPVPAVAQVAPAADTPGHTAAGVQLTEPKGWAVTAAGPVMTLVAPESDLRISV